MGVRPWGSESLISKCDNKLGQNVSVRIGKLAQKAIIYSDKEIEKEKWNISARLFVRFVAVKFNGWQ